jgi:hypothetical protein
MLWIPGLEGKFLRVRFLVRIPSRNPGVQLAGMVLLDGLNLASVMLVKPISHLNNQQSFRVLVFHFPSVKNELRPPTNRAVRRVQNQLPERAV